MHKRAWMVCAALSCAAHAVTITLWPSQPKRQVQPPVGSTHAWQARAIAPTPPNRPEAVGMPRQHVALTPQTEANKSATPPLDTNVDRAPFEDNVVAPPPERQDQTNPVAWHTSHGEYIPRPLLSAPPAPTSTVLIKTPLISVEPQRVVGVLSLYINEYGAVDHVASTGDELPPAFEQAAIAAFQHITFTPGQLDGQAVKSRIKVEVVFDNTPLEPLPPGSPHP